MRPFLKWAGGKHRLAPKIIEHLPLGKRLIEPFVGSGAVFLSSDYKSYLLSDANADLISVFNYLKNDSDKFIKYCDTFFTQDSNNETHYYLNREEFNTTLNEHKKAALFIYLNRHCFNGLCRYNSSGKFNVPFGRYTSPTLPVEEMLYFAKKAERASFEVADFVDTMSKATPGDVVYCDPPYVPLTATANFTDYASGGFGNLQQKKLAEMAEKLRSNSIPVLISNHDTEFTRILYEKSSMSFFDVQRFISSKANSRGKAAELLAVFA